MVKEKCSLIIDKKKKKKLIKFVACTSQLPKVSFLEDQ